jgi:hypothetical protein
MMVLRIVLVAARLAIGVLTVVFLGRIAGSLAAKDKKKQG